MKQSGTILLIKHLTLFISLSVLFSCMSFNIPEATSVNNENVLGRYVCDVYYDVVNNTNKKITFTLYRDGYFHIHVYCYDDEYVYSNVGTYTYDDEKREVTFYYDENYRKHRATFNRDFSLLESEFGELIEISKPQNRNNIESNDITGLYVKSYCYDEPVITALWLYPDMTIKETRFYPESEQIHTDEGSYIFEEISGYISLSFDGDGNAYDKVGILDTNAGIFFSEEGDFIRIEDEKAIPDLSSSLWAPLKILQKKLSDHIYRINP